MSKVVRLRGNTHAKGRSPKRATFTLKASGRSVLTTTERRLAEQVAEHLLRDERSLSLYDNAARRVVARWVYGRREELRGS